MSLMIENDQIRATLLESVKGLSDEQLNQKVDPEKWTIAQVLVHLFLLERGLGKWISMSLENNEKQTVEQKPVHLTLDRSRKFSAPANIVPRDEFTTLEAIQEKLSASRADLYQVITGVSDEELEKRALPHPGLGPMNLKQWVEFVGLHEKRHLEQIEELKQELLG